jgi:hypothetical protein
VQIPPRSLPLPHSRATLSTVDWLGGGDGACYFSAHEHALRNPSRHGQTAPSGTGDPARTPRPETRCAPNDNGGIAGCNANAGSKSSTGCGIAGLPARRTCHSRRSSTTSALSVADELLGFFSAGKALRAGVGFHGISRVGCKRKPCGDWVAYAA